MKSRNHRKWLEPDSLAVIAGWRRDGLSEDDIAVRCGVSPATLSRWKACYPALADALRFSGEAVDYMAESALLKRALGYDYTEETWEYKPNKETGSGELMLTKKQVKHLQPDVSALQFWLKKRRKQTWGDAAEAPAGGTSAETGVIVLSDIASSDEETTIQGGERRRQ